MEAYPAVMTCYFNRESPYFLKSIRGKGFNTIPVQPLIPATHKRLNGHSKKTWVYVSEWMPHKKHESLSTTPICFNLFFVLSPWWAANQQINLVFGIDSLFQTRCLHCTFGLFLKFDSYTSLMEYSSLHTHGLKRAITWQSFFIVQLAVTGALKISHYAPLVYTPWTHLTHKVSIIV